MKKKPTKKEIRTGFARHDAKIASGHTLAFAGWFDASEECVEKFGGNASAYAKSAVSLRWTGRCDLTQTETSIRLYVSSGIRLINKYGSRALAVKAYDAVFTNRDITSLMAFSLSGKKPAKKKIKKTTNDVAVSKRSARSAWNTCSSFDEFWEQISE